MMKTPLEITEEIEDNWGEIVYSIVSQAKHIFEVCESSDDFCLQHCGVTNLVFGGYNRLTWSAKFGFRCDKSYCRTEFIELFEENFVR